LALVFARGIARNYLVTLEVARRRSGRRMSLPLVMVIVDGQRYLVSMLGENAAWIRNIRAANGEAVLQHGRRQEVRLEEIPAGQRAPVLKTYLQRAPGARPHVAVDKDAPLSERADRSRDSGFSRAGEVIGRDYDPQDDNAVNSGN
jgi:hypothetical protein